MIMVCLIASAAWGQTFQLERQSDSLTLLRLADSLGCDVWRLPYPTFAFATADVDADGVTDALVGVVKPTRFDPRPVRRLFAFRNVHGRVRPLWLGSRLCGQLEDFRAEADGEVVTLERDAQGAWLVGRYVWDHFGFVLTAADTVHTTHAIADSVFRTQAGKPGISNR